MLRIAELSALIERRYSSRIPSKISECGRVPLHNARSTRYG